MSGLFGGGSKRSASTTPPPAVGAMRIQQSSYGVTIPLVYGTNRISGNIIWYDDFKSYAHEQQQGGAGKGGVAGGGGGKGGGQGGNTTYTYSTSFMLGLCEGPISGVRNVYETKTVSNLSGVGGALLSGAQGQSPWGYIVTNFPAKALNYSRLAYVAFANKDLGQQPETPNYSFEIEGLLKISSTNQDAYPDQIISDFIARAEFPTAYLATLTSYRNYTGANSFFFSPALTEQRGAAEILQEWADTSNSEFVWSNGKLSIIPHGDSAQSGNGFTFTPNLVPIYALNHDDFLFSEGEDPIEGTRADPSEAYNQVTIEWLDRNNQFNPATYTAEDPAHIDKYGVRPMSSIKAHHITFKGISQNVANLILWRNLNIRMQYRFKLDWRYVLLDPMDYVSITDANQGIENELVRIVEISEDEEGALEVIAEETGIDVAAAALFPDQDSERYAVNYNETAPSVNDPIIFEPTLKLLQTPNIEVWVAVSGSSALWGGCNVWISSDGVSYSFLSRIVGNSRHGVLRDVLASGVDRDTINTLKIDMGVSRGQITTTPTQQDADNFNTLSYVDGELIAFGGSSLAGSYQYDLTYLRRGAYDTPISAHAAGTPFARLDNAILRVPVDETRIGQTLYLKFVSFNHFTGGLEDISNVPAYTYNVTGAALAAPLGNPTNLRANYVANILYFYWDTVDDLRSPIYYEIRRGASWNTAQFIDVLTVREFATVGIGTYWIAALYTTPTGQKIYSDTPAGIIITGAMLVQNVVQTWDEKATGWAGTKINVVVDGDNLRLDSQNNILSFSDYLAEPDILYSGMGVFAQGIYEAPAGHTVTLNSVAACQVSMNWSITGQTIYDNILTITDLLAVTDLLGAQFNQYVSARPQIALSQDGTTWGVWQDYAAGVYQAKAYKPRLVVETTDPQVYGFITAFDFSVDAPDRMDNGNAVAILASGSTISYDTAFNSPAANINTQITIVGASSGDDVVLSAQTQNGFTVQIMNSGVGVARTINWVSQGY